MRKPYPLYKDSEVEWIGQIPDDWKVMRLGMLGIFTSSGIDKKINEDEQSVKMVNFMDIYNNNSFLLNNTRTFMTVSCPPTKAKEHQVRKGDLLFLPSSETQVDLGASALVDEELPNTVFSYHLVRFQFFYDIYHSYKKYLCNNHYVLNQFSKNGKGTTRQIIGRNVFRNIKVMIPSISEQKRIVSFLDNKIKLIDELIEKTKQKIELLKEKRTSLINHSVTKGLNSDVEMKDSGIEWIGKIPTHWKISKFKYDTITPVRYGLNIGSDRYTDEGVRFIRITDLDDWGILSSENGKYLIESDVGDEFLLNKYDLLLCRSGHTVGKSYLHLLNGKYTSGGYLVRFNFGNYYSSKFIFYITKTHFYCNWIFINTIISTIENVNGEKYSNFDYPKPPLSEQQQIVDYLDSQTQKIDTLIKKENKRIELLKEYRQSLISEAVTGKIDLRDEVAV